MKGASIACINRCYAYSGLAVEEAHKKEEKRKPNLAKADSSHQEMIAEILTRTKAKNCRSLPTYTIGSCRLKASIPLLVLPATSTSQALVVLKPFSLDLSSPLEINYQTLGALAIC